MSWTLCVLKAGVGIVLWILEITVGNPKTIPSPKSSIVLMPLVPRLCRKDAGNACRRDAISTGLYSNSLCCGVVTGRCLDFSSHREGNPEKLAKVLLFITGNVARSLFYQWAIFFGISQSGAIAILSMGYFFSG